MVYLFTLPEETKTEGNFLSPGRGAWYGVRGSWAPVGITFFLIIELLDDDEVDDTQSDSLALSAPLTSAGRRRKDGLRARRLAGNLSV